MIAAVVVVTKVTMGGSIAALLWLIPFVVITFIGSLFLRPYREATYAAFYRAVAGLSAEVLEENVDTYHTWNE